MCFGIDGAACHEDVGAAIGTALSQGEVFGEAKTGSGTRMRRPDGAYVSMDATGVGIQGNQGAEAEGRMINIGMVYNLIPEEKSGVPVLSRFAHLAAAVCDQHERTGWFGAQSLRQQGAQVGMDRAERWIAISDGGNG